jgi:DNA-binding MarR family transcriptional regulator/GNAT superfamily N-acetyltransferase
MIIGSGSPGDRPDVSARIEFIREFNRFYTRQIGLLEEGLLDSPFTLTQARVLWELAHRDGATATELSMSLKLDPGYLSRVLRRFQKRRLIRRERSTADARQILLRLTRAGEKAFAELDRESRTQIQSMLDRLSATDQERILAAMDTVRSTLGDGPTEPKVPYMLRSHQPGDMGWVVQRHGVLYAQEYGWDETFEALVAQIVAKFIQELDPKRERCWIAEREGVNVGSVFLVHKTNTVAQLRLLLVEPTARGLGIGRRLVEECIRFARLASYRTITLWTNDVLHAARHIYETHGFKLVHEEPHHNFGHDLVGQTWELTL